MNEVVLDASVLLALLNAEAGAEEASRYITMGIMSTVNLSEVVAKLSEIGMPEEAIREVLNLLPMKFVPFDEHLSYEAGLLRPVTKERGLSLGDRACLSLGLHRRLPVVTTDRVWKDLGLPLEVILIR